MAGETKRSLTENFYDVLGVSQTASEDEIADAERALLKLFEHRAHLGDANATDMMRRLNEAHATLGEEHKRAAYDRTPDAQWHAFVDVAYSPRIDRFEKLRAVAEWVGGGSDPVREATQLLG